DVAGEEARVGARLQSLARVCAHHADAAFERDQSRARRPADGRRALERVAETPDEKPRARRKDREHGEKDGDVDKTLLDDPPLNVEAADSGDHIFGLSA